MYKHSLDTPIEYLKGVGPERAEMLKKELQIFLFGDLLEYYPYRYIDKTKLHKISEIKELTEGTYVQLRGHISSIQVSGEKFKQRLTASFTDGSGVIDLIWFKGIKWIKPQLSETKQVLIFGRLSFFKNKPYIAHPEMEETSAEKTSKEILQPVYSSTDKLAQKGLNSKGISKLIHQLWDTIAEDIQEILPPYILHELKLLPKKQAQFSIHFPTSFQEMQKASFRLKFEELLFIQLQLLQSKKLREIKTKGYVFSEVGTYVNTLYKELLPYDLTQAQKRVIKEIRKDVGNGIQMNRLLQGDVGSGKTIVALFSMLIALDNGYQAALMAPTEILAQQHFETFSSFFKALHIPYAILTGSTKASERKKILLALQQGEISIIIGTHALLEDSVVFKKLGFVVIDEQHKFGVAQRAKLWKKSDSIPPHILVMTATPIPRTLALTYYGDLDVSVIDELPPGRKPVKTVHQFEKNRLKVWGFLKQEIQKGRQVYVVFPLIEESETLDYQNLMQGYEALLAAFPLPEYKIGVLHGKMKPEDKEAEMQKFSEGKTHILISTTVIEVGVNVPNANIMVIESAEKFGLSQLHQLRGRVGRGAEQSYCFLMTSYKLSAEAKIRLQTMVKTNDGFEIAEADLNLRGPGDIMGTMQSGIMDLKIAHLGKDADLVTLARSKAKQILEKDPLLESPEHQKLKKAYVLKTKEKLQWIQIS